MSKKSRRKLAKKSRILLFFSCVIIVIFVLVANNSLHAPLPTIKPQSIPIVSASSASTKLAWPLTGQAAIGASGYGVLATNGNETPVPTASIAKIITALAILQIKPLAVGTQGPTITLNQTDVDYYNAYAAEDGSVALVTAGEQISEYQLIQGMLLPSANNMADSLAVWAFGSLSAYAAYANHMLDSLGLQHTHVGTDASGFLPDTTSTASDLVSIGEIATANPVIASVASQSSADLPVAGTVRNVNWLLGSDGIDGLKTGNSNQDSGAFLFTAPYKINDSQPVTIVGVVLQSPTLQKAMDSAVTMLASAQKALNYSPALTAGEAVGQYPLPWGGTVTAITKYAVPTITWQGKVLNQPHVTLSDLHAPVPETAIVGQVGYTQNNVDLPGASPVVLSQLVHKPSVWWRIFH